MHLTVPAGGSVRVGGMVEAPGYSPVSYSTAASPSATSPIPSSSFTGYATLSTGKQTAGTRAPPTENAACGSSLPSPGTSTPSPGPSTPSPDKRTTSTRAPPAANTGDGRDSVEKEVLKEYPEVVNASKKLPKCRHHMQHVIETTCSRPISSRYRRLDPEQL